MTHKEKHGEIEATEGTKATPKCDQNHRKLRKICEKTEVRKKTQKSKVTKLSRTAKVSFSRERGSKFCYIQNTKIDSKSEVRGTEK